MTTFTSKRKIDYTHSEFRLGWCQGPIGAVLQHQPQGPDGKPTVPLDAAGNPIPGTCPGSIAAPADTRNYKKGTLLHCGCPCHGEDRPEPYPGYDDKMAGLRGIAALAKGTDDDEVFEETVAEEVAAAQEAPPVVAEVSPEAPPLSEMGNPSDPQPEAVQDAPASAGRAHEFDDGVVRTQVRVWPAEGGAVVQTSRQGVISRGPRKGEQIELTEWIPVDKDGAWVGPPQWSKKAARSLVAEATS